MMGHRLAELEMRRRRLLLKSARLRSEFGADQRYVLGTLSGVDRYYSIARGVVKPVALVGAGLLILKLLRRRRRSGDEDEGSSAGVGGFAARALVWVSMARRLLPLVGLARAYMQSRAQRRYEDEGDPAEPARY
jgi:hypothetical protein